MTIGLDGIPLQISTFGIVIFALLALLLFVLLRGLRRLLTYVPLSKAQRTKITLFAPLVEILVWLIYLLTALPMVVTDHPEYAPFVVVGIVLGLMWVSWFAIRDFVNGVFFKAGQTCQLGDHVRIGDLSGNLVAMGYRTVTIETDTGEEAIVPYSHIGRESVIRTPVVAGVVRHCFRVMMPTGWSMAELKSAIYRTALNHHWSSVVRDPQIEVTGTAELTVTVYALEADRTGDIEMAIRNCIAD